MCMSCTVVIGVQERNFTLIIDFMTSTLVYWNELVTTCQR